MEDLELLMNDDGALAIFLVIMLVVLIVAIIYLLRLQKAVEAIAPESRKMSPGQVWLMLIPLFNIVWQFIMVHRIADSFKAEFQRLQVPYKEERPTYGVGIAMCILGVCGNIPVLGVFASLAGFICWIVYWVKVEECHKLVIANQGNDIMDAEQGIFHK